MRPIPISARFAISPGLAYAEHNFRELSLAADAFRDLPEIGLGCGGPRYYGNASSYTVRAIAATIHRAGNGGSW